MTVASSHQRPGRPDRPGWMLWCSVLMVCGFLVAGAWLISENWQELSNLGDVQWHLLVLAAGLGLVRIVVRTLLRQTVFRLHDLRISLRENLAIAFATTMMNSVLPLKLGSGWSSVVLKQRHGLPFRSSLSILVGINVYLTLAALLVGAVGAGWLWVTGAAQGLLFLTILVILILAFTAVAGALVIGKLLPAKGKLQSLFKGWTALWSSPQLWPRATVAVLLVTLLTGCSLMLGFAAFGIGMDASGAAMLVSSQRLGNLTALTPAGLGFQELVGAYFASGLGVAVAQTVLVLATMRLVSILSYLGPGLLALFWLKRTYGQDRKAGAEALE